ncbi:hypothetical protein CO608_05390 [Lysobacteraceae bacterium NML08-0793]|nr:hypothetical protein CO608_05390 [Xanthomonadaceae bacterium NML08-0793]
MIDLSSTQVIEPVIEHLLHRIRRYKQQQGVARVWGWLFVHGLEEGCTFELALGSAPANPAQLLQEEIWNYPTPEDDQDFTIGSAELAGIWEAYDLVVNAERPWSEHPALHFQGWTLAPVGEDYEWQCQGFTAHLDEPENTFIARVYRHILQQAVVCYPEDIEGFVLEIHDSALPREWIEA